MGNLSKPTIRNIPRDHWQASPCKTAERLPQEQEHPMLGAQPSCQARWAYVAWKFYLWPGANLRLLALGWGSPTRKMKTTFRGFYKGICDHDSHFGSLVTSGSEQWWESFLHFSTRPPLTHSDCSSIKQTLAQEVLGYHSRSWSNAWPGFAYLPG